MPARRLRHLAPAAALAAALGACAAGSTVAAGDAAFRSGDYDEAWRLYQRAGDPSDDADLALRVERTRWFLIEDEIRRRIAEGAGQEALDMIGRFAPEAPADRARELSELLERAQQRVGAGHAALGLALIEADEPLAAQRELTMALAWNPQDDFAAEALARVIARLAHDERVGEIYYFEGMDYLRVGHESRARTSFHHSAVLLGENSKAQARFEALTEDLAAVSRSEARAYLQAGALGPAFLRVRTAERLEPEHPETLELAGVLDAKVQSERGLMSADLAIRGGRTAAAAESLQLVRDLGVEAHAREAAELEQRNRDLRLEQEYNLARAFELDEQVLHAARAYRALLESSGGYGHLDAELRLSRLEQRAAAAAQAFERARAAEAAGDAAAYLAALEETVRLASDYEDALMRLAAVRGAAGGGS